MMKKKKKRKWKLNREVSCSDEHPAVGHPTIREQTNHKKKKLQKRKKKSGKNPKNDQFKIN